MRLNSVCQRVIKKLCTSPAVPTSSSSTDVLLGCPKAAEHPLHLQPFGEQHTVIPGCCNCAFQNPTQRATAISFPFKIPPQETWPSISHSKSLPKSRGHHFPMWQSKAKPIPFNKQAVATFIGLLENAVLNVFLLTSFLLLRFSGLATNTAFYFPGWNSAAKTWNTRTCLQKKWDISLAPY